MPHGGDWRAAGVDAEAEALVRPLHSGTQTRVAPCAVSTIGAIAVEIAAVKPSEDGHARIIRLVEKHGGHGTAVLRMTDAFHGIHICDCLERPIGTDQLVMDGQTVRVGLKPFQIVTLRVEPLA
tara:strand:- start:10 stop:381 length:372 start_codon:yes stop_codon:yes gene_type:complete